MSGVRRPPCPRWVAVLAALLSIAFVASPATAAASQVEAAAGSVVAILSGADQVGSGVVIAPGLVLTTSQVASAAPSPRALIGGREAPLRPVATEPVRGVALLAADTGQLPSIPIGDSNSLRAGDNVTAVWFPTGKASQPPREGSVTPAFAKGVVTSPLLRVGGRQYIQARMPTAHGLGDGGGVLVASDGAMVGLLTAGPSEASRGGVWLAVPSSDLLEWVRAERPDAKVSVAAGSGAGQTVGLVLAGLVVALGAFAFPYFLLRRQTRRRPTATESSDAEADMPSLRRRRAFHVSGPARDEVLELRLPAVVGHAPDSDLRVEDHGVAAHHARIDPGPRGGVTVLDLTDEHGIHYGEQCVLEASIEPGESFRVGATTITLLERHE